MGFIELCMGKIKGKFALNIIKHTCSIKHPLQNVCFIEQLNTFCDQ